MRNKYSETNVVHELEPIYSKSSKILILGSLPSVKSREIGFYYGHPKNRFWKILSIVLEQPLPESNEDKKAFLIRNNIALWDVIKSCNIKGSSDNTITKVICNDINMILKKSNIKVIFTTGKKAFSLYNKYCYLKTNIKAISLPSTSPANCRFKDNDLINDYKQIRDYLS